MGKLPNYCFDSRKANKRLSVYKLSEDARTLGGGTDVSPELVITLPCYVENQRSDFARFVAHQMHAETDTKLVTRYHASVQPRMYAKIDNYWLEIHEAINVGFKNNKMILHCRSTSPTGLPWAE